jgi:uncharacterized protein YkwD
VLGIWLATAAQPAFADTTSFSNNTPTGMCLQDFGTPYPSTIEVSGMNGPTSAVTVTLGQYNSPSSSQDVLLVSPAGKTVLILSDIGSEGPPVDITLDDAASQPVPVPATTGIFQPTDNDAGTSSDTFTGEAPAEPYGTTMSALSGDSPNGTWKLYVAENTAMGQPCMPNGGSIATWSLNLTTTPPAVAPPVDQPPPEQQSPLDPTAPVILSAEFSKPPVTGDQTFLQVLARDPDSRISGLTVDFGEALGLWAESSCIEGQPTAGGTVQFDVPYRYLAPGPHTITITVLSGGCGQAQATQQTKTVTVGAPAAAASRRARASLSIPGPTVTSRCKNARMAPTRRQTKAIVKALLCVMNEQRKLFKLKPLKNSKRLSTAALAHSRSMVLGGFFAHQGPTEPALVSRLKRVKFAGAAGENLGAGAGSLGTPVAIVDGWMHSALHRANLLSKRWRAVGIGFLAQYPIKTAALPVATYTTDFGSKP